MPGSGVGRAQGSRLRAGEEGKATAKDHGEPMHRVVVFVGSLRADSFNRKLARSVERLAKDRLTFEYAEIGDLPMYNDDLWKDPPAVVLRHKELIAGADAVLLVTPEYNRSVPPVLVNAIAWGSRPLGKNAWSGKTAAIIGASNGSIGTAVSQAQLRSSAVILGLVLLSQPEVYINWKPDMLDEAGNFRDEKTTAFLEGFVKKFDAWITRQEAGAAAVAK
jgi:chromate reductase